MGGYSEACGETIGKQASNIKSVKYALLSRSFRYRLTELLIKISLN